MTHFENPADKIVNAVTERASQGLMAEAYDAMKSGLQRDFSNQNAKECKDEWQQVSDKLAANGLLPKMATQFLKTEFNDLDPNHDGKIDRSELTKVSNSWHPMYKGFATQALKDFDVTASLGQQDNAIDRMELKQMENRQWMPARDVFVNKLVHDLDKKLNDAVPGLKSPLESAQFLYNQVGIRMGMETPAERIETLQAVTDALKKNNMIAPLASAWLESAKDALDTDKDGKFSRAEVEKWTTSKSPLVREFASYVCMNFDDIPRGPYPTDKISLREADQYADKMNVQRWQKLHPNGY